MRNLLKNKITLKNKIALTAVLLLLFVEGTAHNGKGIVPSRPSTPVAYYQWFMIVLAITYSLWLTVRAQKRKANKIKPEKTETDNT